MTYPHYSNIEEATNLIVSVLDRDDLLGAAWDTMSASEQERFKKRVRLMLEGYIRHGID